MLAGRSSSHAPLRGLRVLEWGDFIAVPYAARLLADAGADVLKIEPPEGDSARCAGPFPSGCPDPRCSGLFAYLNRGKRVARLDLATADGRAALRRLAEAADLFLHEEPMLAASPLGVSAQELRAANPRLSVVSLTPFGEWGPCAGQRADDLVLLSASGIAFATPGYPDHVSDPEAEPPLRPNANLGEFISGIVGAAGALLALLQRQRTAQGTLVEISKQEALSTMMVWEHTMYAFGGFILGRHPARTVRTPNHYLPTADGWAVIVAYMDHHWQAFVEMMGNFPWAQDPRFSTLEARGQHWEDLEPLLLSWLLQQPGKVLLAEAQRRGIPSAPALTIAEAIENEHMAARQFLVPSGLPGDTRGRLPGDIYVIDGQRRPSGPPPRDVSDASAVLAEWLAASDAASLSLPPPVLPESASGGRAGVPAQPLAGLRVVDFGQIVAMPLVGQWLAFFGAEVILVESRTRLATRGMSPFAGQPSPDTSGIFNTINRNKRSCTINVTTPEGLALAKRLIATADIVIENYSPGTMAKLGLDNATLRAIKPDLIICSLSACGSTGPWRTFSALHSGVILLSGIAAVTGYEDGHPRMIASLIPDPIAGVACFLAILQAVYHRQHTGEGQHIEVAMTETLQSMLPEAILEYTMHGREQPRIGNRHPWRAPHGIYRAAGPDRWLALSVGDEAEWRALCATLGQPALADDPRFASAEQRRANAAALDEIITAWSRARTAEEAAAALQRVGVPASAVLNARDVLTDAHMRERGFIVEDEHPLAGRRPMAGVPWRLAGVPLAYRHAPLLGQDNAYVFCELLGLSSDEVRRLEEVRAIY